MIKYVVEDGNNSSNLFLVDEDYNIKVLVAVIFDKAHSRIIKNKMNEYVKEHPLNKHE